MQIWWYDMMLEMIIAHTVWGNGKDWLNLAELFACQVVGNKSGYISTEGQGTEFHMDECCIYNAVYIGPWWERIGGWKISLNFVWSKMNWQRYGVGVICLWAWIVHDVLKRLFSRHESFQHLCQNNWPKIWGFICVIWHLFQ